MENFIKILDWKMFTDITPDMDYVDTDFGFPDSRDNSNDDR
jgi:hypothetical protein